ncbi:hypothetical protein N7461_009265 [Penicillium sp. DV-2018c]|nr:hypothetical protein N7461_009265 [Penicillium sp. DV-2018c]
MKKKKKKKKKRYLTFTCQMNGLRTAMSGRPPIGDNAILSEIIWLIIGRRRRVGPKAATEEHYPEAVAPRKLMSCLPSSLTPTPAVRSTYCVTGVDSCRRLMSSLLVELKFDAAISVVLVSPTIQDPSCAHIPTDWEKELVKDDDLVLGAFYNLSSWA